MNEILTKYSLEIIAVLFGLVNFLFWNRIKRIERDIELNKNKSTAIEKNYLIRFEKLNERLNEIEKNIIREIGMIRLKPNGRE